MPTPLEQLLAAAQAGDLPGLRDALDAGADINGLAPMTYDTSERPYIIPIGGKTAMHLAVEKSQREIVEELIRRGADANALGEGTPFFTGEGPIHVAARRGDVEFTRILIAGGSDPHLKQRSRKDVPGRMAIQLAVEYGQMEIVQLLLDADKKRASMAASAALFDAAQFGRESMVPLLIEHGGDANKFPRSPDWNPLMMACFQGFAGIAKLMIDAGADLNVKNKGGQTPLYMVIHGAGLSPDHDPRPDAPRRHLAVAELLLERGAEVGFKTKKGETGLEFAKERGRSWPRARTLIPLLEKAGQRISN